MRIETDEILIEEIPENVFQDISFNNVEIFYVSYLERIHTNAFNNITAFNSLKKFYISSKTNYVIIRQNMIFEMHSVLWYLSKI